MGETANQIETHIEHTRQNLGSNLQELEQRVKSATDWRQHFQKSPMTMIGVAFGGGVLLAAMMGGPRRGRRERSTSHAGMEAWNNIKGALLGVAATRFKDFVDEVVPGFHEHYDRTQRENTKALPLG